jgi:hypothetical protein
MQEPIQPLFQRLSIWAMSVAFATAAFALAVLAFPLAMLHHHMGYKMMRGGGYPMPQAGGDYGMMHAGGMPWMWHIGMLLVFVLWAGISGAIVAAVYNAVAKPRA